MLKSIILPILSLLIVSSCNVKNPLSKKNQISYLECPKSLILAPGSNIVIENTNLSLNKDYNLSCYFYENESDQVVFDLNYNIELNGQEQKEKTYIFEFWLFVTDKKESSKLTEYKLDKKIITSFNKDNSFKKTFGFEDQLKLDRNIYDNGVKIFLSLN
tara:strand:+ start:43 stop:519 length:477 start_codon:yes stop_codon:yes gene_type:complete